MRRHGFAALIHMPAPGIVKVNFAFALAFGYMHIRVRFGRQTNKFACFGYICIRQPYSGEEGILAGWRLSVSEKL